MGFGAIWLLPLVGLAAIPVIIHILSRLRLQKAAFPSLLLLASVRRERFSWLRLKELLLLILRTLALLFLLLALARPYVRFHLPGAGRGGDLVVVLDDSYSMSYGDRWERARMVTRSLLKGMATGQRVRFLLASGGAGTRSGLSGDSVTSIRQGEWQKPAWVLARLDSLKPTFTGAVLEPALRAAVAAARPAGASVVAVTDLQERAVPDTWRPSADVRLVLFDIGSDRFDNAGIERAFTTDRFPIAGRPVRIKADLANYGASEVTRTAALSIGPRREEKVVSIPARGRLTVEFETAYTDTASGVATVELRSDSLATDDTRRLAVTPLARVRTLVVQSAAVPARFLTDALGMDSTALFNLEVVDVAGFGRVDVRDYGLVVITDAAALGRADWTRLGFYLQARGAALLMAGTAPADSTAGQGLVRFLGQSGGAPGSGFVSVTELDTTHPALELLRLKDFADARFFAHARFDPAGGRVLARLIDGDPLMFEAAEGRLIVWAFAPAPVQTDVVYKAAFVPLLHRTLASLASLRLRTDYLVGDTIRMPADGSGPVEVITPGLSYQVEPGAGRGRPEVVFARTDVPGAYSVGGQPVAVNVPAAEGDLTRATAKRLAELGYEVRSDIGKGGSDLTQLSLWLAVLAFALEMLLLL